MHIAVLIKQVPDTDEVRMDPERGTMIREGVGNIINPLDLNALEAGLQLKRGKGAQLSVYSMGPPQAETALREATALGADRAVLLSDRAFAGSDTWSTSFALAAALRRDGPFDLILAGEKATDGETGQVGPEVATMLDLPFATFVSGLALEGNQVEITRSVEEGFHRQSLPLPCLLTVLHDLNDPSMPTLAGKKQARRCDIPNRTAAGLGLQTEQSGLKGSPTRVVHIEKPTLTRSTEFYRGRDLDRGLERVVAILREKALL
ncbi:MAG: electron transfer flavoprotein subunit beta/FixA family protein [Synergistales bacterium]|nr:electron transfer flavoprotein subunit beta/FixA family protein [Synergistales bacterium]